VTSVPIRLRLAAAFTVAMAAVIAATGAFGYAHLSGDLSRAVNEELQQRAEDLSGALTAGGARLGARTGAQLVETGESFAQVLSPDAWVLDATSTVQGRALFTPDELRQIGSHGEFSDRADAPGLNEPVRLLALPMGYHGRPSVLVVGLTLENRAEALRSLRDWLLVGGPLVLLAAAVGGYLLASSALRPVEALRRAAARITARDPAARLPQPRQMDELGRLSMTLNDMLGRMHAALARERDFVAAASHDLRTPLAALTTELELALRRERPPEELRAAIAAATLQVQRLTELSDDLLAAAQSDEAPVAGSVAPVDLVAIVTRAAAIYRPLAAARGRALTLRFGDVPQVEGHAELIARAVRNMLDNALKHGAGEITVAVHSAGDAVGVHVTDDGPGFSAEFLPHAFDKFSRADPARAAGGSGLGLAVVQAAAGAHDGAAVAENRPGGGPRVSLTLAVAPRSHADVGADTPGYPGVSAHDRLGSF
jgi:signal transduction histidine kinase